MLISKEAVKEYLNRDLNSYLWMKGLTRGQLLEALRDWPPTVRFTTEAWQHQLVCYYVGLCEPRFLYLLDMGLGKTLLILMLLMRAKREVRLKKALVLVPRILNMETWQDAAREHSHLVPHAVTAENIAAKWQMLANPVGDFTVIDYQGFALAVTKKGGKGLVRDDAKIRHLQRTYNFLVYDEIHKLKNHQSLWFGLARQLRKDMDYVYGLTGTLFGNDLEAIWSQFFLVDGGETFGENLGLFRAAFFTSSPDPWAGVVYTPRADRQPLLHKMLQHKSLRYDEAEAQELPVRVEEVVKLQLPHEQRQHYLRALEGLIEAGGKLRELDAQWIRMRQITSGYLAWKDDYGSHQIVFAENPKMEALLDVIERASRTKVVVCYDYTETAKLITARLAKEKVGFAWIYGGTKDKPAEKRKFMENDKCRVLVLNSEAGGTGVDGLQKVASVMFFYESPTNPITRGQTLKRIHRPGSTKRVRIIDAAVERSVDRGILDSIKEGRDLHEAVVDGKNAKNLAKFFGGW